MFIVFSSREWDSDDFFEQHGNKKKSLNKSLNKIDYNQLHSLMQDDKWSDFSERSLVKLNFKIFNSGEKSLDESQSSRELKEKKNSTNMFCVTYPYKKPLAVGDIQVRRRQLFFPLTSQMNLSLSLLLDNTEMQQNCSKG